MQILKNKIPDTSSYAIGLIEAEEARRIAREREQAKFDKANGKLNIPSSRQKPIVNSLNTFKTTSSEMIDTMNSYVQAVHQPSFEALMQEEYRRKSGSYETYSTPSNYSSNSSPSSSSSDSSSCSDSSSSSSSSCD